MFIYFLTTEYWIDSNQLIVKKGQTLNEYISFDEIKNDFKLAFTHGAIIEQIKLEFDEHSPYAEPIEEFEEYESTNL
jgi:hypothetical protein